jgi:hypothetical protein
LKNTACGKPHAAIHLSLLKATSKKTISNSVRIVAVPSSRSSTHDPHTNGPAAGGTEMKIIPCLSGHAYIKKDGRMVHLSPNELQELHDFLHRENLIKEYAPQQERGPE